MSRVLNAKPGYVVSEEVAEKIRTAARELGYKTNPFAYSLRVNRSFTIGVLIPDLTNPVFPPIIRGIERTLAKKGYIAILADSDNDPAEEERILERLKARQTDGLILATAHRADELVADCLEEGYRVVLINRSVEAAGVSSITNDDHFGIAQAVRHLASLGHRQIAHVAGPQAISTGYQRYLAFREAMQAEGLAVDDNLIAFCDAFAEKEGRRAMAQILARSRPLSAVVAANDLLALGCYDAIEAAGRRCPEEISVTGYNDMPFADKFKPPLTTVHIPLFEMGIEAAEAMLALLDTENPEPRQVRLRPELVVRGSTARAPAGI
ncbi:MAG: LacI family transcriptional regulator [Alphaproteobacteria bacterium]|nr:MAG: LacI family transcriptional regulator [Alphaproteobacteria bacterium]